MPQDKSTGQILSELWELLQAYAKQQTVDPLKALKRYLSFGLSGAVCLGLGIFFLSLALLRVLQAEAAWFDESWWYFEDKSPLIYLIVVLFLGAIAALFGLRLNRAVRKEQL